ncbi:MAG: hypothetical protein WBW81_11525 [Methylocella sp.]
MNEWESSTKQARFTHRITKSCDKPNRRDLGPGGAILAEVCHGKAKKIGDLKREWIGISGPVAAI